MKSLLASLKEGRLIELPEADKDKALEYLAVLIEAIPDIEAGLDLVKQIKDREAISNTGIGMGVACPHARSSKDGELQCAVGWSPAGIEYNAPDGKKVHIVVMYYIPDTKRNDYLKEISNLAKAIGVTKGIEKIESITDINNLRAMLLDWVEFAIEKEMPELKARMIQIDEKRKIADKATTLGKPRIIPFTALVVNRTTLFVLSQNANLTKALEKSGQIIDLLFSGSDFEINGYKIAVSSTRTFEEQRMLVDCVAFEYE
jgi:PTS system nitrogen regulatory IIA component